MEINVLNGLIKCKFPPNKTIDCVTVMPSVAKWSDLVVLWSEFGPFWEKWSDLPPESTILKFKTM